MTTSVLQRDNPRAVKWTRANYRRAWEMGFFGEAKVELVWGEVIEKMPMNPPHATVLLLLQGALLQIFGNGYCVRQQSPFLAGDESEPEPDLAVVRGTMRDYVGEHPEAGDALLVVEVSDATLAYDLGAKATLYAASGVADYWVVDIPHRKLHVHRSPVELPSAPVPAAYLSVQELDENTSIAPLAAPSQSLLVRDLLP